MRMTWRERLADWISGGKLTEAMRLADGWQQRRDYWAEFAIYRGEALRDIAAMETPGANGTVKRMAKRAREALE